MKAAAKDKEKETYAAAFKEPLYKEKDASVAKAKAKAKAAANRKKALVKMRHPSMKKGDVVEARWKFGRKWYKAKVVGVNDDGSVSLHYDDGKSWPLHCTALHCTTRS